MKIEYESTFINIDKEQVRKKLKTVGAQLVKSEFLQKRSVFSLPKGHEVNGGWLRVRDESDKITMSLKIVDGNNIEDQKEIYLVINDFKTGINFLETIGCKQKAYQENKREIWQFNGVEICLDEWPFLKPVVEVEGDSEEAVKQTSLKLGFDWAQAQFCAIGAIYSEKYDLSEDIINNRTPKIVFDMENPFLDKR